jgi:hypothetical protein
VGSIPTRPTRRKRMADLIPFVDIHPDIQIEFIDKAYNYLIDMNRILFLDEPIEDHPQYDLICDVAEEFYNGDR